MPGRTIVCVALIAALSNTVGAQQWPHWRGPSASGGVADGAPPLRWSATENVRWKATLDGAGTSSPVVWDDLVFVTGQLGAGAIDERGAQFPTTRPTAREPQDDRSITLVVQALSLADGHPVWDYRIPAAEPLPPVHRNHNYATPSVATDGTTVVAWFGTGQVVALDRSGELLWQRHLGRELGPFDLLWGHGSSPVLYRELVFLQIDHPRDAHLLALDAATGATRWHVERGSGLRSYSTPLVITHADRDELIVNSSHRLDAYDPATGDALWHAGAEVPLGLPMPVSDDGVVYTSRGYASGPYLAVAAGGQGDVTETHVRWRRPTGAPYISSLLLYDGLLYMATEHGVVTASDAEDGAIVWRERLGGVFAASPVAANGHVYLMSESGETVVLAAGREPTVVARNQIGERTLASPAIVGESLLIRSDRHLFRIGN